MNKYIFVGCFLLSLHCIAQSNRPFSEFRKRLYLRAGVGNAFAWGGNASNEVISSGVFKTISVTRGISATVGGGYMFGPHIGVQLDADMYMPGEKYSFQGVYSGLFTQATTAGIKVGFITLLMPSIVLQHQVGDFTFYSRMGPALPVINRTTELEGGGNPLYPTQIQNKLKDYFCVGFSGTVGASYPVSKHLRLWAEVSALSMAEYVKSATIVTPVHSYSFYNPQPQSIKYEYQGQTSANGYAYPLGFIYNAPVEPTFNLPYSNIGVHLGATYTIAEERTAAEPVTNKKHVYLKCGVGYAFPMANNSGAGDIAEYSSRSNANYTNNLYNVAFSGKPVSFSAGPSGSIGLGYMLSKHIGAELDLSGGFNSNKYYTNGVITGISNPRGGADTVTTAESRYSKFPVLLEPCLVMQTGGDKLNVYSRIGIVLPSHLAVTDYYYNNETKTGSTAYTNVYTFDLTLGYTLAAGIKVRIAGPLYMWGEATALSLQPYIKQIQTTSLFYDGKEASVTTPPSKLSHSPTGSGNENVTYTMPFSSAGLQVGVSCMLW